MNCDVPKCNLVMKPAEEIRPVENQNPGGPLTQNQPTRGDWGGLIGLGTAGTNVSASGVSIGQMVNFIPMTGPIPTYVLEVHNQANVLSLGAEMSKK